MVTVDDKRPFRNFSFQVEAENKEIGGFQRVDGLRMEMEPETYEEGGLNDRVHKLPGRVSYPNLVLERGLTNRAVLQNWMKNVRSGVDTGGSVKKMRRDVTVKLRSKHREKQRWSWRFRDAYPVKWEGPSLTAGSTGDSMVATQTLELTHEGFEASRGGDSADDWLPGWLDQMI